MGILGFIWYSDLKDCFCSYWSIVQAGIKDNVKNKRPERKDRGWGSDGLRNKASISTQRL
jgi:hypothetical protein